MTPDDERRFSKVHVALAALFVVAFALRLAHVFALESDVLFDFPALDEERYVQMARAMAANRPMEAAPWYQPPGLVYALSIVFRVFGDGLFAPRLVQALLSSGACVVTYFIACRFFSRKIAFGGAAICAVHGVLVFESGELLPPTWVMTANVIAIAALLVAGEKKMKRHAFGAGVALGVSAVFAPIVLPFAFVGALCLRRAPLVLAFVGGLALPIAPVTTGNWQRSHELVLVSTNAGINFYLGNNESYDETIALRPGRHWQELMEEPRSAGARTRSASSAYFVKKGLSFVRAHPLRAIGLYLRKLFLYFHGAELPRDTDLYAFRERSPVLAVLVARGPPAIPDGILMPLAIVGIALTARRDARRHLVLFGYLALQAVFVAAFFVTSRYRVPAIPIFAVFACVGAVETIDAIRRKNGQIRANSTRAYPAIAFVALAVALNLPVREANASYAAELEFYRGMAYVQRKDAPAAIDAFRRAAQIDGGDARIWFELGNAYEAARRIDEAIDAWKHAALADPKDARFAARAASAQMARGDFDGAIATLQADVDARARDDASYAQDHLNLSLLRAKRGDYARAIDDLRSAARDDAGYFRSSIVGWARAALSDPSITDAGFFIAVGDALHDVMPDLAAVAWRRAQNANPTPAQIAALAGRLGE